MQHFEENGQTINSFQSKEDISNTKKEINTKLTDTDNEKVKGKKIQDLTEQENIEVNIDDDLLLDHKDESIHNIKADSEIQSSKIDGSDKKEQKNDQPVNHPDDVQLDQETDKIDMKSNVEKTETQDKRLLELSKDKNPQNESKEDVKDQLVDQPDDVVLIEETYKVDIKTNVEKNEIQDKRVLETSKDKEPQHEIEEKEKDQLVDHPNDVLLDKETDKVDLISNEHKSKKQDETELESSKDKEPQYESDEEEKYQLVNNSDDVLLDKETDKVDLISNVNKSETQDERLLETPEDKKSQNEREKDQLINHPDDVLLDQETDKVDMKSNVEKTEINDERLLETPEDKKPQNESKGEEKDQLVNNSDDALLDKETDKVDLISNEHKSKKQDETELESYKDKEPQYESDEEEKDQLVNNSDDVLLDKETDKVDLISNEHKSKKQDETELESSKDKEPQYESDEEEKYQLENNSDDVLLDKETNKVDLISNVNKSETQDERLLETPENKKSQNEREKDQLINHPDDVLLDQETDKVDMKSNVEKTEIHDERLLETPEDKKPQNESKGEEKDQLVNNSDDVLLDKETDKVDLISNEHKSKKQDETELESYKDKEPQYESDEEEKDQLVNNSDDVLLDKETDKVDLISNEHKSKKQDETELESYKDKEPQYESDEEEQDQLVNNSDDVLLDKETDKVDLISNEHKSKKQDETELESYKDKEPQYESDEEEKDQLVNNSDDVLLDQEKYKVDMKSNVEKTETLDKTVLETSKDKEPQHEIEEKEKDQLVDHPDDVLLDKETDKVDFISNVNKSETQDERLLEAPEDKKPQNESKEKEKDQLVNHPDDVLLDQETDKVDMKSNVEKTETQGERLLEAPEDIPQNESKGAEKDQLVDHYDDVLLDQETDKVEMKSNVEKTETQDERVLETSKDREPQHESEDEEKYQLVDHPDDVLLDKETEKVDLISNVEKTETLDKTVLETSKDKEPQHEIEEKEKDQLVDHPDDVMLDKETDKVDLISNEHESKKQDETELESSKDKEPQYESDGEEKDQLVNNSDDVLLDKETDKVVISNVNKHETQNERLLEAPEDKISQNESKEKEKDQLVNHPDDVLLDQETAKVEMEINVEKAETQDERLLEAPEDTKPQNESNGEEKDQLVDHPDDVMLDKGTDKVEMKSNVEKTETQDERVTETSKEKEPANGSEKRPSIHNHNNYGKNKQKNSKHSSNVDCVHCILFDVLECICNYVKRIASVVDKRVLSKYLFY
ncbi:uncharacterized protein LOC126889611 isoform X2 [Diabrotica virgifera virgifera]|uniref:Uncharacterized protein n=1 Tax=Diabrotica virgifera virgifera TaxID=50390 RepID=A0ABM5KV35_DIAVI|nr:uncharacterized protein LOC126889611 isoform X2 [Diabrotica virgifera virgifera]